MVQNLWEIEQKNTLLHKKYVKKKTAIVCLLKCWASSTLVLISTPVMFFSSLTPFSLLKS